MIFPQEKKELLKFIDQHSVELRIPGWMVTLIHQLVEEHDAHEQDIAEMANRRNERIAIYTDKLREIGWTLNADGEWVKLLPCDLQPEGAGPPDRERRIRN